MNDVLILIGAQFETPIAEHKGFFQLRKENNAADRRLGSCREQSMIAARVQADDGGAGEAADAIGFELLA